jgi:hypothetical protein
MLILNPEKALDSLVEEMDEEEYEEYQAFWDQIGPWRTALNLVTRSSLFAVMCFYVFDYLPGLMASFLVGGVALSAYAVLMIWVYVFCFKLYLKVFFRIDQS